MIPEWLVLTITFLPMTLPLVMVGLAVEVWLLSRRDPKAKRPAWKVAATLVSSAALASYFAAQIALREINILVEPVFVYLVSLPALQFVLFLGVAYVFGSLRQPEKRTA